jgi:carbon starvation protein
MLLWPLFGAMNQLVAGISFMVIIFYVRMNQKPIWFLLPPMAFMLVIPLWALILQVFIGTGAVPSWIATGNWPLVVIGSLSIGLEIWLIIEAAILWKSRSMIPLHANSSHPVEP